MNQLLLQPSFYHSSIFVYILLFYISFFFTYRLCYICRIATRILIHHRITATVSIQIQSIIIDHIFLREPSDTRIVITCTQIVKSRQVILNLCIIPQTIWDVFLSCNPLTKRIILVIILYASGCIQYDGTLLNIVFHNVPSPFYFVIIFLIQLIS